MGKAKLNKDNVRFAFVVNRETLRLAHIAAHAQGKYLTELCRDFVYKLADGSFLDIRNTKGTRNEK